jgi:hypothetical protein
MTKMPIHLRLGNKLSMQPTHLYFQMTFHPCAKLLNIDVMSAGRSQAKAQ